MGQLLSWIPERTGFSAGSHLADLSILTFDVLCWICRVHIRCRNMRWWNAELSPSPVFGDILMMESPVAIPGHKSSCQKFFICKPTFVEELLVEEICAGALVQSILVIISNNRVWTSHRSCAPCLHLRFFSLSILSEDYKFLDSYAYCIHTHLLSSTTCTPWYPPW